MFEWRFNENKQAVESLKLIQNLFDVNQEALRTAGVSDADAAVITTSNKIQRVVRQCKEHHNGPIVTKEELDELVTSTKDSKKVIKIHHNQSEKRLSSISTEKD